MSRYYFFAATLIIAVGLAACSNGANVTATGSTTGAVTQGITIPVSGVVYAIKDSQLSRLDSSPTLIRRLLRFVINDSVAAIDGATPLLSGTVELLQLNSDGSINAVLNSTAIQAGGTYSFPSVTLPANRRLMVSVAGAASMRAFVSGPNVDISAQSEAVVDFLLSSLPASGAPLESYDIKELAAMNKLVIDRNVSTTGLTFAAAVTAIKNDASSILTNLAAGFIPNVTIEQVFGSETDGSGGYTLAEHSIQLADPAGPQTAYWFDTSPDSPTVSPTNPDAGFPGTGYGSLARGSQNGGFSVSVNGAGVSVGRINPVENNLVDISYIDLRDSQFNRGDLNGPVSWQSEINKYTVTPAANGQIVFETDGGRTVVGFATRDSQIVVIPFDKTIPDAASGTAQQIRGVQVMTKRWDAAPPSGGSVNFSTFDWTTSVGQLRGPFTMVEYLHQYLADTTYSAVTARSTNINFDGIAAAGNVGTSDFLADRGGRVTSSPNTATYPNNRVTVVPPPRGGTFSVTKALGTYVLGDAHINAAARAGSETGLTYTVFKNGSVEFWGDQHFIGEGGMTPDGQVVIVPPDPFFAPGGSGGGDNVRGYLVFGKQDSTLTLANLAGTYNVVGHDTYLTNANGVEGRPENRYGTLVVDNAGHITGGEFFKSTSTMNFTNMFNGSTLGNVVSATTSRELVAGGTLTFDTPTTGAITITGLIVNTVDTNGTPIPGLTLTLSGSGFVAKGGDFVSLQLNADNTATSGERGIMFLGKQH